MAVLLLVAVAALILLALLYVILRRAKYGGLGGGNSTNVAPPGIADLGSRPVFSRAEVATHNRPDDLWLIINNKVYNFTDYIALHPGGEAILRNAGGDSTEGFGGSQHPARVKDMIPEFYIGDLKREIDDTIKHIAVESRKQD